MRDLFEQWADDIQDTLAEDLFQCQDCQGYFERLSNYHLCQLCQLEMNDRNKGEEWERPEKPNSDWYGSDQ